MDAKDQRIAELEAQVKTLTEQVAKLTAALEEARRAGKRQAAPFRKKKKAGQPKKPGRKPGDKHGQHFHREAPTPEEVDERYEVPVPDTCSCCSSSNIVETGVRRQYQTDIVVSVTVRQFDIHIGECEDCGAVVAGRHELQTSDALGAAGHQLGSWVHAAIAMLNKCYGLSYGKIERLFWELFQLKISRSTGARSVLRTAKRCQAAAEQIQKDVRGSPQVVPDETGWRVGGNKAWLHAFATPQAVWYEIDPTRSGDVIRRVLGADWSGQLVHDGWSPYDSLSEAVHQQCNAHLLRRCQELLETAVAGAVRFPRAVKELLLTGLDLRDRYHEGELTEHGLLVMAGRLKSRLRDLVLPHRTHAGNERFAWFLYDHQDDIFAYLQHPGMDATNWRGEQAIRPAVVNRKVWGGNRTWAGAIAQSVITSLIQTCRLRRIDPFQHLIRSLTTTSGLIIPQPAR